MELFLIFIIIQFSMVAFAYTEAVLEGKDAWARNRKVWRFKIGGRYDYTSYHLVAYYLLFPLLIIALPLVISGFNWSLFWFLLGAYLIGTIIQDFFWFIFNPEWSLKQWNPNDVDWYLWIAIGKFHVPVSYAVKFCIAILIFLYVV